MKNDGYVLDKLQQNRPFRICLYLFSAHLFGDIPDMRHHMLISAFPVGDVAAAAILDSFAVIAEIAAAALSKRIKRAIAEQAVKILRILHLMAGKILT